MGEKIINFFSLNEIQLRGKNKINSERICSVFLKNKCIIMI